MAGDQEKFRVAMMHAERFSQQRNWNEALRAYRFALAEFPNNEHAIVGFGRATLYAGHPEQAWRAFHQALKINPTSTAALGFIADIQAQMGQKKAAGQTYVRIGNVYSAKSELEAAMQAWHKATELAPDLPDAHRSLAQGLRQQGKPRLAARHFLHMASIFQYLNQSNHARQALQQVEVLVPNDPGLVAAKKALQQGQPIDPEMISESPPAPPEPEEEDELSEFDFDMGEPEEAEEFEEVAAEAKMEEDEEFDPFSEEAMADFLGEEAAPIAEEAPPPPEEDWDWLGVDATERDSDNGLLEEVRQMAMSELANVLFEDDEEGPEVFLGPDGQEISRMEINMLITQGIDMQKTQENYEGAIENYRKVVQANAGRPALYFNLGLLYQEQEEYQEATKMLRLASQDPDYQIGAQFALGHTYFAMENREAALRHFIEALKMLDMETVDEDRAGELEDHYYELMDVLHDSENPQKFDTFVATVTKFFFHYDWDERVVEARQKMDGLEEDEIMTLAEFLETPETKVVVTALATTADLLNREVYESASEECLRAIQRAPNHLRLHSRLADILLRMDMTEEAVKKYLWIANVYEVRRQPEQAVTIFQKVLKVAPMDVTVRSKLIEVQRKRNNFGKALEHYLALADSYYQLAQVNKSLAKYEEAMELTEKANNPAEWQVQILNQIADIYSQRFEWDKAVSKLEQARKLDPENEQTRRLLIDLYYKQGKTSQALKILDDLLEYYYAEKPAKAVSLLRDLTAVNFDDLQLKKRMAIAYIQNGRKQNAIEEYDALGEMQLNLGLRSEAIQTIEAILELGPDNPEGYQQLLVQINSGVM